MTLPGMERWASQVASKQYLPQQNNNNNNNGATIPTNNHSQPTSNTVIQNRHSANIEQSRLPRSQEIQIYNCQQETFPQPRTDHQNIQRPPAPAVLQQGQPQIQGACAGVQVTTTSGVSTGAPGGAPIDVAHIQLAEINGRWMVPVATTADGFNWDVSFQELDVSWIILYFYSYNSRCGALALLWT